MDLTQAVKSLSRPFWTLRLEALVQGQLFIAKQLAFTMQSQNESNWCWAATATSVSHFYSPHSTWTQCSIVCGELNRTDCCSAPVPDPCDVPWYLERALERTDNLVEFSGPVGFDRIKAEIDSGRPVGARVRWSGGGGHFVVIYGYGYFAQPRPGVPAQYLDIDDPIYHKTHLSIDDFSNGAYQGSGSWTHTYFTRKDIQLPWIPLTIDEPTLRRIEEMKQILDVKQFHGPSRENRQDRDNAEIGFAHHLYNLDLDAVLGQRATEPQPNGIRVYESDAGQLKSWFDIPIGNESVVRQMSASDIYLEAVTRALDVAMPLAERSDHDSDLRLLRVPALNFEAIWLAHNDNDNDRLVPLRRIGTLQPGRAYRYGELLDQLRRAAQPLARMDDTMGA